MRLTDIETISQQNEHESGDQQQSDRPIMRTNKTLEPSEEIKDNNISF